MFSPSSNDTSFGSLTFTALPYDRKLIVLVDDSPVALTLDQYHLLAQFAAKRRQSPTGRLTHKDVVASDLQHFRMKVHRLRRAIDASLGRGCGELLIQNGVPCEYRLCVPAEKIFADGSCVDLTLDDTTVAVREFPPPPESDDRPPTDESGLDDAA